MPARVYGEMLLQVCRDYAGLPDPRTLTVNEIRYFYRGLRAELKKHTTKQESASKPSKFKKHSARRRRR